MSPFTLESERALPSPGGGRYPGPMDRLGLSVGRSVSLGSVGVFLVALTSAVACGPPRARPAAVAAPTCAGAPPPAVRSSGRPVLQTGHHADIHDVAIADDGAIATASKDGEVRVWDGASFAMTALVEAGEVDDVSFAPDGSVVVVHGLDSEGVVGKNASGGAITVFDRLGRPVRGYAGHYQALAHAGSKLLLLSAEGLVRLADEQTCASHELASVYGQLGAWTSLHVSRDAKRVAFLGSGPCTTDPTTGKWTDCGDHEAIRVHSVDAPEKPLGVVPVRSSFLDHDVTGDLSAVIRLRRSAPRAIESVDVASGAVKTLVPDAGEATAVRVGGVDGGLVAASDRAAWSYGPDGAQRWRHDAAGLKGVILAKGHLLLDLETELVRLDPETGKQRWRVPKAREDVVRVGRRAVVLASGHDATVLDVEQGRVQAWLGGVAARIPRRVTVSHDGSRLHARGASYESVWSLSTGQREASSVVREAEGTPGVWLDPRDARAPRPLPLPGAEEVLARARDADVVVSKVVDGSVVIVDAREGRRRATKLPTAARGSTGGAFRSVAWELSPRGGFAAELTAKGVRVISVADPTRAEELAQDRRYGNLSSRFSTRPPTKCPAWEKGTGDFTVVTSPVLPRVAFATDDAAVAVSSGGKITLHPTDDSKRVLLSYQLAPEHRVARLATDGSRVAVGTADGRVALIGDAGLVRMTEPTGAEVRDLVFGGRHLVAAGADGAVRVLDAGSGRELATLTEFEDDEHVASTPSGAFVGSAEARERLAWVFDAPTEAFRFEQFARALAQPEVVAARLRGGDRDLAAALVRPPRVDAAAPTADGVRASVRSSARVDRVDAFVDGRRVASKLVCAPSATVDVAAPPGATVHLVAFDADGFSSNPVPVSARPGPARSGDLHVFAFGVSRYPALGPEQQLDLAADDARAIAGHFQRTPGPYARVHSTVLTDDRVTTTSVLAALDGLAAVREDDLAIVFFAGHGAKATAEADMVFMTSGASATREGLRDHGVGWGAISEKLRRARGRVLVLLDACHSGHLSQELVVPSADLAARLAEGERAGVVVFAAAKGRQPSYEPSSTRGFSVVTDVDAPPPGRGHNGYFTGAILDVLGDSDSDRNGDGVIDLSELVAGATHRVVTATGNRQTPWLARREIFGDFRVSVASKAHAPPAVTPGGCAATAEACEARCAAARPCRDECVEARARCEVERRARTAADVPRTALETCRASGGPACRAAVKLQPADAPRELTAELLRLACMSKRPSAAACAELARRHCEGDGVPWDPPATVPLLRRACSAGLSTACAEAESWPDGYDCSRRR